MLPVVLAGFCIALSVGCFVLYSKFANERTQKALALQKVEAVEQRLSDYEQLKVQFEQYAKAAALETGNQLSNKLLQDHQRAREDTHKQFEQFTKTASEQLLKRQQELAGVMGKVQGQVNESTKQLNVLVRAMQNPIGAGAEGEIVLNNILQQHGFTEGLDYDLQIHLTGEESSFRPDGVIYLPHGHAVILDAKASHHIFTMFASENETEFEVTFTKLRDTMRNHAKGLASKSYRDAMRRLTHKNGQPFNRTTLIMFVPNDEIVSRLHQRDAELSEILRKNEIILLGPSTLSSFLLVAASLVREERQINEQHAILEMTQSLMGDFLMAIKHADKIIRGIRASAEGFDEFSASINRGLSRMRKMRDKGLPPAKNQPIPNALPRYEIAKADEVIQGESEELVEVLQLPKDNAA